MAIALAHVTQQELEADPTLAGRYVESFVAAQLRPEVDAVAGSLHHLRTRGGDHEIDLVIDVGGRLIAFDVKSGVHPTRSDARHLTWMQGRLGDRLEGCVVLHRGSGSFEVADDIWAIPISTLWTD